MKALVVVLLSLFVSLPLMAEEEKAPPPAAIYINLFPALVGNFGTGPKLKFFKADISLRVASVEAEAAVKHHDPLIRNQLVMLFSEQTEASMAAADSKELLRQQALKQVQDVLTAEEGKPLVEDLLFNNLIIQ